MSLKETDIHKAIVAEIKARRPDLLLWHTPNGFNLSSGYNRYGQLALLKKMGLLPGMPDLFIFEQDKLHALEIKSPNGRLTGEQDENLGRLADQGARVGVCWSVEEGLEFADEWGLLERKLRGAA